MIAVQHGLFGILCAREDQLAKGYFEAVRYRVGVADLGRADEHVELLLYVMEYTPTLRVRSLAHTP